MVFEVYVQIKLWLDLVSYRRGYRLNLFPSTFYGVSKVKNSFFFGLSEKLINYLTRYDLTPTMRDINKKFSVRYYLNLVLVDEEDRRYFKQQVREKLIFIFNTSNLHEFITRVALDLFFLQDAGYPAGKSDTAGYPAQPYKSHPLPQ